MKWVKRVKSRSRLTKYLCNGIYIYLIDMARTTSSLPIYTVERAAQNNSTYNKSYAEG